MACINDFVGPDRSEATQNQHADQINCQYMVIYANGWPQVFVVASRDIKPGELLRIDYGDNFWSSFQRVVACEEALDSVWTNDQEKIYRSK